MLHLRMRCESEAVAAARKAELVSLLQLGDQSWSESEREQLKLLILEWDDVFTVGKNDMGYLS